MSFLTDMLKAEGEINPSSKRVITLLAFVLVAIGFVTELFFEKKVSDMERKANDYEEETIKIEKELTRQMYYIKKWMKPFKRI